MAYNASARKSPVVYDLAKSDFMSEYGRYIFSFSTRSHMEKFDREIEKREEWLCDSLTRRFHVKIDAKQLAAFQLYMQIEGRGFLVHDCLTGNDLSSPSQIEFVAVS